MSSGKQASGGIIPRRFVRFASIHPFIGFAVRADAAFDAPDEPERQSLLSLTRLTADGEFKPGFPFWHF